MKAILNFILSTLRRFFIFLKKPNLKTYKSLPISQKFATILILLVLQLIFINIYIFFINQIFKDPDLLSNKLSFEKMGFGFMLLLGCLIAPLTEEFVFRFPLKYKRNYIFLLFSSLFKSDIKDNSYKAKRFYRKYFGIFFFFMAFLFALVHFSNFKHAQELVLYLPFLVLSQFFGGLILGFIRIRLGFLWSVFYHSLFNFVVFTFAFSAMDESKQLELLSKSDQNKPQTEEKSFYDRANIKSLNDKFNDFKEYTFENNKISLKINKSSLASTDILSYFGGITPDTTSLSSMSIKNSISMFMGVPFNDVLVNISDSLVLNYQLKFKQHQKNSLKTKDLLLFHLIKALSLKLSYDECTRVSWKHVIINRKLFNKKTEGFDKKYFESDLSSLNNYWSVMYVQTDSEIDVFNPDEEIFKENTKKMNDLAREIKSYGVDLKEVRTRHKLVLVE